MNKQISRRQLLQGMGVGAVGLAAGSLFRFPSNLIAHAAGESPVVSAFHRYMFGKLEITVIQDGLAIFPSTNFGVNATEGAVDKVLKDNNMPEKAVNISINVMLVKSGDQYILLDSGAHEFRFAPDQPQLGGRLLPTFELLGIKPEAITAIILTHYHPDHIAGIADAQKALFPKATVYLPEAEQKYLDTAPAGTPVEAIMKYAKGKLAAVKEQVKLYKPETEIVSGIKGMATPGHTPGHTALMLESDGKQLIYTSDVATNPVISLSHPEWFFGFDEDGKMASETRRKLLDMVSAKTIQIFSAHFPFPGLGYVDKDGEAYRFFAAI